MIFFVVCSSQKVHANWICLSEAFNISLKCNTDHISRSSLALKTNVQKMFAYDGKNKHGFLICLLNNIEMMTLKWTKSHELNEKNVEIIDKRKKKTISLQNQNVHKRT